MTARRIAALVLAAAVVSVAAAYVQPQQVDAAPRTARMPVVQICGPHSDIKEQQFHLVTDQKSLNDLWVAHRGDKLETNLRDWPVVPTVDFKTSMVVAYFRGPSRVTDGEVVYETHKTGADDLVIRFDALTFQTMTFGDEPEPDYSCTPYGIWVLDKHDGTVILEEDKRRLINAPPEWTEIHRFNK